MLGRILVYRYAIAAGLISWTSLFLMQRFTLVWVFILTLSLFTASILGLYYLTTKQSSAERRYLPILFTTMIAFVGLTSLIEWTILRSFLDVLSGAAVMLLFVLRLHSSSALRYEQKPWRRMLMILWIFDGYAIVTTIFAFGLLFLNIPFWIFSLLGGMLFGYCSLMIWKMYFVNKPNQFILWVLIISMVMLEVIWVAHFLPLGHLALGLIVTWLWYIIQLLVRFHLSSMHIIWKKQCWFLISNAILYAFFLFFVVRWI
ncbi:MAG: hypothetical protein WC862_04305 [Patescibacteria group bacterium]